MAQLSDCAGLSASSAAPVLALLHFDSSGVRSKVNTVRVVLPGAGSVVILPDEHAVVSGAGDCWG